MRLLPEEEKQIKRKSAAVIGMMAVCFMMMVTMAWSAGIPGVPNGTVTDGNLVWLQNADCFGYQKWDQAMSKAASLKSGDCGLTDGSKAGDWRLPTNEELLVRQKNKSGFNNVQAYYYWSSTTRAAYIGVAWRVSMGSGVSKFSGKANYNFVWPVRAGQ